MTPSNGISEERNFMDHPEVESYLVGLFPLLIAESDRGAVLLGVSKIDEQLRLLFESLLPQGTSKKRKDEIFNHTGPFGGFAAKLDIAYTCRLLPSSLIDAIHRLRKLRNDVAHQTSPFTLKAHHKALYDIFALLGPGIELGVNRVALELMFNLMLGHLSTLRHPLDADKFLFDNNANALDYLSKNRHLLAGPKADQPRVELGVGIGLICGLIIYHRDRLVAVLDASETFVAALRSKQTDDGPDA
jgi:hypothetical protein